MDDSNYRVCSICGSNHYGPCATAETTFIWQPQPLDHHIPKKVCIAGSWRHWQTSEKLTQETDKYGETFFRINIMLLTGTYEYKYIVDGQWRIDPRNPVVQNQHGTLNNFIKVRPLKMFVPINKNGQIRITSRTLIQGIKLVGSWDNWTHEIAMEKVQNHLKGCLEYMAYVNVQPDKQYQFRFKLKKQWLIDEHYPNILNSYGSQNNIIITQTAENSDIINSTSNTPLKHKQSKIFNVRNFQWTTIPRSFDLPYKRVEGHSMCCIGDDIYIFGGFCRRQFYSSLTKINIQFTSAKTEECWPNGRAFHNAITYGNKIIIFGGHNKTVLQDYYSFNVTEQKWAAVPHIAGKYPCKKEKQSCVIYSMLMVFFGGYYCTPDFQFQEYYKEISVLDIQNMRWIDQIEVQGEQPVGRCAHTAILIQSEMFIFGGTFNADENLNLNDIWKINLQNVNQLTWTELKPKGVKPCPRHGHSMNPIYNYLILFGGVNNKGEMLNDLFVYDVKTNQWFEPGTKGNIPLPRYYHASTVLPNDNLVIFGGRTKEKKTIQNIYLLKPTQFTQPLDIQEVESQDLS